MHDKLKPSCFPFIALCLLLCGSAFSQTTEEDSEEVIGPESSQPPAPQPAPPAPAPPQSATLSPADFEELKASLKEEIKKEILEEARAEAKAVAEEAFKQQQEAKEKKSAKSDFMDTRITWVFGDDDFLADAGEKIPDSPLLSIGDREGYELFMDNIDSRYSGRENLTHLVMYKKLPGFFPRVTTEAALVLKFQFSETDVDLTDDGTYLRLHYRIGNKAPDDGLSITLFPFDTERFRLGYLWDISWGGGSLFTNKRNGWAPGAKVGLKSGKFDFFVGFKTAKVSEMQEAGSEGQPLSIQQTNYGILGGAGYDFINLIKLDFGAGFFEQGTFEFNGIQGKPVYSFGGSLRLAFHRGEEVGVSSDFALYRNDPYADQHIAETGEDKKGKIGFIISLEGTVLVQHLGDPDNFASTKLQPAYAAAGQGKVRIGNARIHLTAFFRTLEFIMHNVPSFTPFMAIPDSVDVSHEIFVALGFDYFIPKLHMTPGIIFGVQLPAAYTAGGSTIVVRSEEQRDILVHKDEAQPIITGRVSLKFDMSEIFSLIAFVQYVRDVNRTRLKRDELGTYRVYTSENELGAAIVFQARF